MSVKVCVSTCWMPLMASTSLRKSASGAKPAASHSPKESPSKETITLKSMHPPQTTLWTLLTPLTAFTVASCFSNTFWAAAKDALSSSGDHFMRHSRATVSNSVNEWMNEQFIFRWVEKSFNTRNNRKTKNTKKQKQRERENETKNISCQRLPGKQGRRTKKGKNGIFQQHQQQRTDAFRDGNLCDKCKDITRVCMCVCVAWEFLRG